ncbi:MAG: hypothetical protein UT39_C0030G0007 [Candidatus Woesebacteria bacterium GW2011_GWA1_39_21]|uniref:Uncharacterized protein n=1 Tax=Candidatus Woesebacteria bacterium GW2011_GWA1_39_21 TaxID=1618550 RepID=A0A0G0N0E2_9BACT|nr:MAG: hypothetical protein UT39_C0030G0007 [Candidatus Woesebacteria bacterium GW2011_GWA1_39_21]
MAIRTPEQALEDCAREACSKSFEPDNPQMAARIRAVRRCEPIDEKQIVAEGGCDHPDPTLSSVDPRLPAPRFNLQIRRVYLQNKQPSSNTSA